MKLPAVINVLRPGQWIKNLLVLAGFLFALADQSQPLELEGSLVRTLLAFVIFCLVKAMNRLYRKKEEAPAAPPAPSKEEVLLTEIRDLLKDRDRTA